MSTAIALPWSEVYKLAGCCRSSAPSYRSLLFDEGREDFTPCDLVLLELAITFCRISSDRRVYTRRNFAVLESKLRLGKSSLLLQYFDSRRDLVLSASGLTVVRAFKCLYPELEAVRVWSNQSEDSNLNDKFKGYFDARSSVAA